MKMIARNMSDLAELTIQEHLNAPKGDLDAILNIETHIFDALLSADDGSKFDLDVGKDLWLNRSRWSRLTKEYVPKDALERFIGQAVEIMTGTAREGATANMLFRDPDRYAKKHRWGGCLMGLVFRAGSKGRQTRPRLTMYSRTTYMGYMGLLDMTIAARIIQEIKKRSGYTREIAFTWHLGSMQLHAFKTLPYIFSQPNLMDKMHEMLEYVKRGERRDSIPPTWWHICKWYNKILEHYEIHGVKMLEHEKYGPFKRIKRRWLEYKRILKKHIPPSLKVHELDFSKCV
jgi:hypothetical protein